MLPGPIDTRTGGYEYDRRIIEALRAAGWTVEVRELRGTYPFPDPSSRAQARQALAAIPDAARVIVDGLAFGALPDETSAEAARLRLIALVHHPLARETGLDEPTASQLFQSERRALAGARHVIVTGRRTAATLAEFGIDAARLSVVEPGTDPAPIARGSGSGITQLLSVATLTPRKGHELLIDALASIPNRRWQLACVGSIDIDPPTTARVRAVVRKHGLENRVSFEGEAVGATLAGYYDRADVFVLATWYEGYGMAVAEAMARGLPVISTATGGIPDIVPDDAGVLVAPGDRDRFRQALASVLDDETLRRRLAEGARRARERLPTWEHAGARFAAVLDGLTDG
jgi:glycosyltransferase involved in cell wall biosynthesis